MGLFGNKDPKKKDKKKYKKLLEEARDLQRAGDIPAYAKKMAEADELLNRIESKEY